MRELEGSPTYQRRASRSAPVAADVKRAAIAAAAAAAAVKVNAISREVQELEDGF